MSKEKNSGFWLNLSPWIILGALVILLPIFAFMTLDAINTQKAHTTRLLVDKGAALIRAFEAGTRTGMGMRWGFFELQKLLIETAQQVDIDHLIVTNADGRILACSDPSLIGETYGLDLDLARGATLTAEQWRQVPHPEGADTFEVYRRFAPIPGTPPPLGNGLFSVRPPFPPPPDRQPPDRAVSPSQPAQDPAGRDLIIFVGLDMSPIEAARREDAWHTALMAIILLLIGFAGIVSLMLAQGFRTTRASLSRVQAFSDHLVTHMPMGLVAIDAQGLITAFNTTAAAILEREVPAVLGRPAAEILPSACLDIFDRMREDRRILTREIDCPVGNDRIAPLECVATVLLDEAGGAAGKIALFRDMTELRRLKQEVARSQRLASVGSLAAGVAHEIRNPLSSLKGFATYFRDRHGADPEDGKIATIMIQEAERLNRVIGQLLEFARPPQLDRTPTDLAALVRQALDLVAERARASGVALRTEPADLPEIRVDGDRLKQVLLNLFLNALAAMEGGGTLSVTLARDGERVRITVADTGAGIKKEDMGRVF
ncbi:MAG TPA: histidine kinase dimerization/phospho-acceptor domain-containing protein, partial [Syntrophales bacterium]|nr:histidine kinase dimerization/phospho-acceptor domain-containing protein [Syntrophales bacterium]